MENQDKGIFDVLQGNKALQFEVSLDPSTIAYILGGAILVGIILITISKKAF